MDMKKQKKYEAQAKIMKALSHPTRLFIVNELAAGERCVCEFTDMVGVDTSTISKHLALLKNAGIVDVDKRGTSMYYSLKMRCVLNFFICVDEVLQKNLEEQLAIG